MYFRMYIFFEIDHLNSLQKKPAGYWLTQENTIIRQRLNQ